MAARSAIVLLAVLCVACGPRTIAVELEPVPTTASPASTAPEERTVEWEAPAFDLHGVVRLTDRVVPGVASIPSVFDDGEPVGEGRRTTWTASGVPEPVERILGADCGGIGSLLNRWADALYRLDVPEGEKAQADAYLGVGMARVAELGCDYEPDLEGRALPFP